MRRALGDGYVDAVRSTWTEVPESADFVMYWWHIAGETVRAGVASQFGFITTNSIKQTFNRRVASQPLSSNTSHSSGLRPPRPGSASSQPGFRTHPGETMIPVVFAPAVEALACLVVTAVVRELARQQDRRYD